MPCKPSLFLVLASCVMTGCATNPSRPSQSWYERTSLLQGPTGSDVVQIDMALLEQPVGDRYLNEDLWFLADEQFMPLDRKRTLADNGLRVGQISGITPPGLHALLTSERSNPNPRETQMRAKNTTSVELGPVVEQCHFGINKESAQTTKIIEIKNALCTLELTPSLADDGRVRLRFLPRVGQGSSGGLRGISPQSINWLAKQQKPDETFEQLAWDVSLLPNEYIVVGGRYDRPNTLGHACFIRTEEVNPIQRLLVIRVTRLQPESTFDPADQMESVHQSPPLALQAAWTISRADEGGR